MAVRARKSGPRGRSVSSEWLKGSLTGRVAAVIGASRGGGRGIALALGDAGATVYVAGRTTREGPRPGDGAPGTIEETAEEVTRRGGRGIPARVDAVVEADVAGLFRRIAEDEGRLDVLANASWGGNEMYGVADRRPFWENDPPSWRNFAASAAAHLAAAVHAARLMAPRKAGLIVSLTEPVDETWSGKGALFWMLWGIEHQVINRTVAAASRDLKTAGIAIVALAPGFMRTERVLMHLKTEKEKKAFGFEDSETPEYAGRAVAALAGDPKAMRHAGKLVYAADLARAYCFTDVDGTQVGNFYRKHKIIG